MSKETVAGRHIDHGRIALPPPAVSESQDREWCVVHLDGGWRKIRFHDYDEIYRVPGLYEMLFYDILECSSPRTIREMLEDAVREAHVAPEELRVLDLGAGNGMVGEELSDMGVRRIVGVDIIEEAADAAARDRPGLYERYLVTDMTEPPRADIERLGSFGFNGLTCVAALGFGDIPPEAFSNALALVDPGGWVAFNIKSDFLESREPTGFAALIRRLIDDGVIAVRRRRQYRHRLATSGEPLMYTALIGVKTREHEA